jgi:hypothetical protein
VYVVTEKQLPEIKALKRYFEIRCTILIMDFALSRQKEGFFMFWSPVQMTWIIFVNIVKNVTFSGF